MTKITSFIRLERLDGDKHPNLFKGFVRLEKLDRDKHPSLFHLEHHKRKRFYKDGEAGQGPAPKLISSGASQREKVL